MMSKTRVLPLLILAVMVLSGCRNGRTWGDLSEPVLCSFQEGEPVDVATELTVLPIITEDSPDCRWAAMYLAQTIEETCGRKPKVLVERPGQDAAVTNGLFVGNVRANGYFPCPLSADSEEAFRVVTKDRSVHFVGRADFAVFDWCERVLGVREYPVCGKSVRFLDKIVVPPSDYSDRPVFDCRVLGFGRNAPWRKLAKCGSAHRGGVAVHQPCGWVTNAALKTAHPQLFENGETPMLCYGNPETLAYYQRRIDRHIAGEEDSGGVVDLKRKVVTVSQWDAPIRCSCRHCTSLYDEDLGESGKASPIIWGRFLKGLSDWLKTAHPDYEISFLPYLNTCQVPKRGTWIEVLGFRLQGRGWSERLANAEAQVCTMPGAALLKNAACKAREERIIRDWCAATGRKVLNWHYICWPRDWTAAPYVFGRTIQRHYADMADTVCGSYVCGSEDDPRMALSAYVWMRCLWNPDVDVEAIYDEFAIRMFGPSAVPMRRLIALQEKCWNRQWNDDACSFHNIFEVSFPPEDVARMKALVHEADERAVAANDGVAQILVRWYASGFEEFVAESDALAARTGRVVVELGQTHEMVNAQSALRPVPWARTTVTTAVADGMLALTVRCQEPAVGKMDFSRTLNDFVYGNDCVVFAFDDDGKIRTPRVDLTGHVERGWNGFSARVCHDATGWTVDACVRLGEDALAAGRLMGNVTRWRIGDRRLPEKQRIPGSRYEESRLNTCFTNIPADPAAFVEFRLTSSSSK